MKYSKQNKTKQDQTKQTNKHVVFQYNITKKYEV